MAGLTVRLREERKKRMVIPEPGSEDFFRAFRDCQPSDVKVVILGQDPYYTRISRDDNDFTYDGYAFSNSKSINASPSLRNIIKEVRRTYPDNLVLDEMDLSRWVKQGVLLVNTALTVIENIPDVHTSWWRPFTEQWVYMLDQWHPDIVWLLWGNKAQSFSPFISKGRVIKTGHPSPLNTKYPFIGCNCFVEANKLLKELGKSEIFW